MVVSQVLLNGFRHFQYCHFNFNNETNLLVGCNGSGKTSILEAVYYLAYAKSFRSRSAHSLIMHQEERFQIDAKICVHANDHVLQTAYGNCKTDCYLKVDKDTSLKQSQIAKMLPVVFIDTSTHREFSQTPKNRRDYINWCCFYSYAEYHHDLLKYQRVLQQRNHLLKQQKATGKNLTSQLATWTDPLIFYAQRIHKNRTDIVQQLNEKLSAVWPHFFSSSPAHLDYHSGWKSEHSYADCLEQMLQQDIQYGYTQAGPHRADLYCMTADNSPIFQIFSQGQQKIFSYLLRFIQLDFVSQGNLHDRILLIDDLPAELDVTNQERILDYLNQVPCQKFVTALHANVFNKRFCNDAIFVDTHDRISKVGEASVFSACSID